MRVSISADIVPIHSNQNLFEQGNQELKSIINVLDVHQILHVGADKDLKE